MRGRIRALDPEILCLTEAYLDFWQEPGYLIACEEDAGYPIVPGRRKVLLWSERPWRTVVDHGPGAMPPGRYIYGETGTSLGLLGVHGLCIPRAGAHVHTGQKNRRRWQDHLAYLAYLAALPAALDAQQCRLQLLAGDFNQRIPRKRDPLHVYEALQTALAGRFTILTQGIMSPAEQQTIDHLAATPQLAARWIQSISNIAPDGRKLTDQFGIAANLVPAP